MTSSFQALMLHEEAGKVTSRIEAIEESALPPGEVLVAVEYSTLNYKDGLILSGLGRLVRSYPHVPGIDFAGTVEHSDVPDYKPGDKVVLTGWRVGETQWGGYAQKARVKAAQLVKLPDGLTHPARHGDRQPPASPRCWRCARSSSTGSRPIRASCW